MNNKSLKYYESLLPKSIKVEVHQEEDGSFWAKIIDFKGCYTQGNNFGDLIEMISDAMYTVLDIPEELRAFLPRYFPQEIVQELKRRDLQEQFSTFIAGKLREKHELSFSKENERQAVA